MRDTIAGTCICTTLAWRQPLHYMLISVLGVLLLTACSRSAAVPSEQVDSASIYAAVIRQIYTQDDTFGGRYHPQTLYVVTRTETRSGEMGTQPAEPTLLSEAIQGAITQHLHDIPTTIVWVAAIDDVPRDADGIVANHGAIITVGPIAPQSSRSMHVPASIHIGPLAAGGRTYVVEQNQAGTWQITGTTGEEWIS
jgi:hypothetical protein